MTAEERERIALRQYHHARFDAAPDRHKPAIRRLLKLYGAIERRPGAEVPMRRLARAGYLIPV